MHAIQAFHHNVNHIYKDQGKKETIDTLLARNDGLTWTNASCNEYGRLAQEFIGNTVLSTDTIDFIHQHEVPPDKKVTYMYSNFICDYRPLKTEPYRLRLTGGRNKLPYDNDAGSPLLETKLIINSTTISDADKGARFLCADLRDHFLASPMKDPEFMRIRYKYFPDAICKQYNLDRFVTSQHWLYLYIQIKKGMYGLKHKLHSLHTNTS